jgi:hypothetical protein
MDTSEEGSELLTSHFINSLTAATRIGFSLPLVIMTTPNYVRTPKNNRSITIAEEGVHVNY